MTINSTKYRIPKNLSNNIVRSSVGLIVLNTDFTFERDFVRLYNEYQPEFDFYFNRIHFANPMTPDSLAAMEGDLTQVSNEILPGYDLDLVVFNCTSSSSILGDEATKTIPSPDQTAYTTPRGKSLKASVINQNEIR